MNATVKWSLRAAMIIALPFILVWAFVSQFIKGMRNAFYYAWLEVRIEAGGFPKFWALCDGSRSLAQVKRML